MRLSAICWWLSYMEKEERRKQLLCGEEFWEKERCFEWIFIKFHMLGPFCKVYSKVWCYFSRSFDDRWEWTVPLVGDMSKGQSGIDSVMYSERRNIHTQRVYVVALVLGRWILDPRTCHGLRRIRATNPVYWWKKLISKTLVALVAVPLLISRCRTQRKLRILKS